MGRIGGDDFNIVCDLRLARRLKRRRLDIRAFEINAFSHSLKQNSEDQQLGDGMEDEEYMIYLNHLLEYGESRHFVSEDGNDCDDSVEEDDADPQYKMFLEKLREDRKSYILEVAINNEMSLSIKYEAEGGSDGECEPLTLSKWRKVLNTEKTEVAKDLRNLLSKDKMETQKNLQNVASKDRMDAPKNVRNDIGGESMNFVVEKDLNSEHVNEPVNHVSGETEGCSNKIHSSKDNHLFEVEREPEMEADMVDECYQTVLDCIEVEGECVGFTINGKSVKYEGHDVETADSEVLVTHNASDSDEGNYRQFETSDSFIEEDEQHCLGSPSTKHYGFREMLMRKLRESYDHEEYEKLWKDINEQRPKGRHMDLRGLGALKTYSANGCRSPSYLEGHDVLKRKIDAVQFDRPKVLNLLRGFFFWLQNLVRDDAFPPWLDPSCLAVMPRNC